MFLDFFPRCGGVGRRSKATTYVEYTSPKGLRSENAETFDFFVHVLRIVQIWMGFKVRPISYQLRSLMYKALFESFVPPVHE